MTGRPAFSGGVYLVTDTALCGELGVVDTVRAAVKGGIRVVQIRDKTASNLDFYDLVMRTADAVGDQTLLLVNDRVDVFLAARSAGAKVHGMHIGQSDMSPLQMRRIVGADGVIGLTVNTVAHIADAHRLPENTVDYFGVGVIRPSATKPDHPRPLGVVGFRALAGLTSLPCAAIGGITVADMPILRRAGAVGAAVVSAICGTPHPEASAKALVAAWEK
ncbi:thiamine phosphate synthase [Cryobacterium sp. PH31-AA6]|uniref:thiamine phosphate synthase n=1 Tax=Cryobacterium sp. PH31-AA6 TaxID=3046205 RepID=UPI0024BB949E|nr:thiamine phosphate synthase [Cryobacterium sp. PH31-AA6]MDJ0324343.1 thiamine phosphate synthase [Cryobacterium sp. PH31-AA6]